MSKRTSPEIRERLVAKFRESGLTQVAFAKMHRINVTTLRSWLYKGTTSTPKSIETRFVEVQAPANSGASALIRIGSQLEVEFAELPAASWLADLARALC